MTKPTGVSKQTPTSPSQTANERPVAALPAEQSAELSAALATAKPGKRVELPNSKLGLTTH